jgi:hypothetical protein
MSSILVNTYFILLDKVFMKSVSEIYPNRAKELPGQKDRKQK